MRALIAFVLLFSSLQTFAGFTSNEIFMKNGGDSKKGQEFKGSVDKKNKCLLRVSQGDGAIVLFASVFNKKEVKDYSNAFSEQEIPLEWLNEEAGSYLTYRESLSFIQYLIYDPASLKLTSFQGYFGGTKLKTCTFEN